MSLMSSRVSLFDRFGFESLRKELRLDPNVVRRLRNDLLKYFVPDQVALVRFPAAVRVAVHALELYHRSDSAVDGKFGVPDPGLCVSGWRVPEGSGAGGEDCMTRQPRLNMAEGVDHVTQRGVEQRDIVADDEDRQIGGTTNIIHQHAMLRRWSDGAIQGVRKAA